MSSIATAAASESAGASSPQALATAKHSCGRIRAPPGNTAWRMADIKRGGALKA